MVPILLFQILTNFLKDYKISFTQSILQVAPLQLIISMVHL